MKFVFTVEVAPAETRSQDMSLWPTALVKSRKHTPASGAECLVMSFTCDVMVYPMMSYRSAKHCGAFSLLRHHGNDITFGSQFGIMIKGPPANSPSSKGSYTSPLVDLCEVTFVLSLPEVMKCSQMYPQRQNETR